MHASTLAARFRVAYLARAGSMLLLWGVLASAHAASAYRCRSPQGLLAYQDTPCAAHAQQQEVALQPQPLIDAHADPESQAPAPARRATHARTHRRRTRRTRHQPATSWECRAADGEVFYRHTRCPSSVPGDGVVRAAYARVLSRQRGRHDAWSRVRVHGVRVPRALACQRIHGVAASSRDGHLRDADVPVYEHLMGRDPCNGT